MTQPSCPAPCRARVDMAHSWPCGCAPALPHRTMPLRHAQTTSTCTHQPLSNPFLLASPSPDPVKAPAPENRSGPNVGRVQRNRNVQKRFPSNSSIIPLIFLSYSLRFLFDSFSIPPNAAPRSSFKGLGTSPGLHFLRFAAHTGKANQTHPSVCR